MASAFRNVDPSLLAALAARVRPAGADATDRLLPLDDAFAGLLRRGGLQRGLTVAIDGVGATTCAFGLVAAASRAGSWLAVVVPGPVGAARPLPVGLEAAERAGVDPARLVVVDPVPADRWVDVVAALVEAVDVVLLVAPPAAVPQGRVRRLLARARERGAVLVPIGWGGGRWPEGADHSLQVAPDLAAGPGGWEGIGVGHGTLLARRVEVTARGRRAASVPQAATLWLPGPDGRVAAVARPVLRPVPVPGGPAAPEVS
ncbi:MAG: hypothetical protein FJW83_03425 [Actinobacteria bacterium]|nr:hypothetical protein [Actinomycetota bacterium]